MDDRSNVASVNGFWFLCAQAILPLTFIQNANDISIPYIPCRYQSFLTNVVLFALCINLGIRFFYKSSGFTYKTIIRSFNLGTVFALGVFLLRSDDSVWFNAGCYLCILSMFHFSEFFAIAVCNPGSLSVSSFILNHSKEYWIALVLSWIEYALESYFFPGWKETSLVSWSGVILCASGEILRKTAMITAAANFNHLVQLKKEKNHKLVTHGVYAWCRHPSYLGWFLWSIGTQMVLLNPVCTVIYAIVSWNFFRDRIFMEEWYLLDFFQEDYVEYRKKVGTGLPFISGYNMQVGLLGGYYEH